MGTKGLVWSAAAMGMLLNEGIGDTIRVSLTPRPGGDRREEVYAACEMLQALGLRSFSPSVTACPGCGRTTSSTFQELAERTQDYIRERMPEWKTQYQGVETMTLAVMGCVVNGPGESKAANIGISLPGTGEAPNCPVFIDGEHATTLRGTYDELAVAFRELVDTYVTTKLRRQGLKPEPSIVAHDRRAGLLVYAVPFRLSNFVGARGASSDARSSASGVASDWACVRLSSGCRLDWFADLLGLRDAETASKSDAFADPDEESDAANHQSGREAPPQADDTDPRAEAQHIAERQPDEPVPRQVPHHCRPRVAEPSEHAGGHPLQAVEQLEHRGDEQQRRRRAR